MLCPQSTVEKVVMEHRGVDAVDDVVVYYVPPGVNERGARVRVDYHQLKFHVAQNGVVDHDAVVDPSWTGTKAPMLKRFSDAWLQIKDEHPHARLSLITNWAWDPRSPVAPLLRDGGRLADDFFAAGPKSKVGQIRAKWRDACGLSDGDFGVFAQCLRFSSSAVSMDEADAWLNDRCQLAGLLPIPFGLDHSPYDDLGARLIESGRTEHTPESLRALVEQEGLVGVKEPTFKSTLAVRSFSRFAHVPETDGACVVDLTEHFEGRYPRVEGTWSGAIVQRLDAALPDIARLEQPVHVAFDAHISISWYVGTLLGPKSGIRVLLRQKVEGKGIELWDVSRPALPTGHDSWSFHLSPKGEGKDIALILSVTHGILADATRFVERELPSVGLVVHASVPQPGQQAVQDGGHARWLAEELVREVNAHVANSGATHIHLFAACPASLAFVIGQGSQVLGPMTVYEFEFGAAGRSYRPGMSTVPTEPV
jgi:hypothetical protein